MSNIDVDAFLMGGKRNSAKFPTVGTTIKGVVVSKSMEQQRDIKTGEPQTWKDGNPKMQAVIGLATDERDASVDNDDGTRYVFAKAAMLTAIRDAVKKNAGRATLELGDELAIRYTGNGKAAGPGMDPPKEYSAWVKVGTPPPPPVDLDSDEAPF